jgi:phosphoribosylformimino-5-aminoimidazole carboxamide ribotide isomerase
MLVIPVIDIKDGKSVRMLEGLEERTIDYCETPLNMARLFRKENAKVLHITDLNGAETGQRTNNSLIRQITETVGIPVQLGGGIRSFEVAEELLREIGIYRIVIGTSAIENYRLVERLIDEFSPRNIIISVDARDGYLVRDAWKKQTDIRPVDFALSMKEIGVERIIYQDVSRVGSLVGPDIEGTKNIALETGLKVTAAGGIGGYNDLRALQELEKYGVDSVMMSRALCENKFPCQAIWREEEKKDISLELPSVK